MSALSLSTTDASDRRRGVSDAQAPGLNEKFTELQPVSFRTANEVEVSMEDGSDSDMETQGSIEQDDGMALDSEETHLDELIKVLELRSTHARRVAPRTFTQIPPTSFHPLF